jgi:hypothetical protein
MDKSTTSEMSGITLGVGHIITMRQENGFFVKFRGNPISDGLCRAILSA